MGGVHSKRTLSFSTVRPQQVAHQIYRLEKIDGLHFAALGATGTVLDAVKEQFSSTCKRLNIAHAFIDADDFARLFWAYGYLCPRDGARIIGGRCHCGYAPAHSLLNVLQIETLKELERARSLAQTKGLVVLPPGSGKTRIAAKDAKSFGASSVLYVAHTHEILDVAEAEFSAVYGASNVEKIDNATGGAQKPIKLATIQFLEKNVASFERFGVDYLVVDEFHHAAARTYRKAVANIGHRFLLGLTATPFRGDRQDIAALCQGNIIVNYELRTGIDMSILTPYHYYGCFDNINYDDLPEGAAEYSIRDLERKLIIKERHQAIVGKWRERADGKSTLAFCCSHRHAETMVAEFSTQGIKAATYLSTTPISVRHGLIERLRSGDIKVLCVVDVLNEGADVPFVECLLFVRPTESKRIFLQQLGRGLRRYVGKSHCVVIDFIGNFRNAYKLVEYHGLRPEESDPRNPSLAQPRTAREILDIPIGCRVNFEDRVLDIFARQTLDPKNATRDNIGRIMIYQYERLCRRLGRDATSKDVDKNLMLNSTFYKQVFGSWKRFQDLIHSTRPNLT
jgi:superfamily II DNA or RNA helicase